MEDNKDKIISIEDELKEAYEADRERRSAKDEELKAAKDYLGVLLSEIENKNSELQVQKDELENKKLEAVELAMKLKNAEMGIDDNVDHSEPEKKETKSNIWPGIAIIEMIVIVALIVGSIIVFSKLKSENQQAETPILTEQPVPTEVPTQVPVKQTQKYNEKLADIIANQEAFRYETMRPTIMTVDGLEYLAFTDGEITVAYKNEYYINDKENRKVILVESNGRRMMQSFSYNLNDDLGKLIPKESVIDGKKVLVISDYSEEAGKIPENMLVVTRDKLNWYDGNDVRDKINLLMKSEISSEASGREDLPVLLQIATSKAVYKYGLTSLYATEIDYNGYELAEIDRDFRMTIDENGISWSTNVRLGEEYYLGYLVGELALGSNEMVVRNAKFGAFVNANAENPEFNGVVEPLTYRPENYLTINTGASQRYYVPVNENADMHDYDWTKLDTTDSSNWIYLDENGNEVSIRGVDVSKYQGNIDWKKVADAGVRFAIIRMGYRGMNQGTLEVDPYFKANMEGAAKYGIETGVYFFSQAINQKEAIEEAEFVIDAIKGYNVNYPVIFDTEYVATYDARANGISYEERTDLCIAFCERVQASGYTPMIYANTYYMVMGVDVEKLKNFDFWYAVYSSDIKLPYNFTMLQYSESGTIPGITGNVDLDISFVDYAKKGQG